ncbi:hypothetical protein LPC08_22605 [Roseomonas sp. OT10]|uniref:hypothetical protein n=1 Tax=Roseomonas cutis TaxID=2897332 RepID=UPI001E534D09|nr:hypothetical protein [Roseomonas sp. OT10]UFN48759.1 hypothetical protein LPC08_22605 [Roseomonas sp. OT10]
MHTALSAALAGLVIAPLATAAVAQVPTAPAPGQPLPRLVIGAPGRCQMTVDGQSRPCTSGLVYVQNANNSILLSVQSGRDVTIGFQGDGDRQPRPEEYTLFLSRMHTSIAGRSAAKDVRGTCEIRMSADGRTWHNATCRATDRNGMVTVVTFTGDGRQVAASRPGQEPASPAPGTSLPKS